jgi:S1-C subfamily serine protease
MSALETNFRETEQAPAGIAERLYETVYGTATDIAKSSWHSVEEHPYIAVGTAALFLTSMVMSRGRNAAVLLEEAPAISGSRMLGRNLVTAGRLAEPAAAIGQPGVRAVATEMMELPVLKGPWVESVVGRVSLPADHWISRAYVNSERAVVQVLRNGERQGTGFFVDSRGFAITNHHVAGLPKSPYQLVLSDGSVYTARVVGIDPQADLAVLRVMHGNARQFDALKIGSSTARSAEHGVALGFPEEAQVMVASPGSYIRHETLAGRVGAQKHIEFDMVMKRGNSGSPVVDTKGNVVAVLNRYSFTDQAYGPAAEHLQALIQATTSREIGSKYLIANTTVRQATGSWLQRMLPNSARVASQVEQESLLSEPFTVMVSKLKLTSKPPISI